MSPTVRLDFNNMTLQNLYLLSNTSTKLSRPLLLNQRLTNSVSLPLNTSMSKPKAMFNALRTNTTRDTATLCIKNALDSR